MAFHCVPNSTPISTGFSYPIFPSFPLTIPLYSINIARLPQLPVHHYKVVTSLGSCSLHHIFVG